LSSHRFRGKTGCHVPHDALGEAMSAHALYVSAAYLVSAIALAGLVGWILADQRARLRELAELGAAGARRRSDRDGTRR
jgi:heme exporter protein D